MLRVGVIVEGHGDVDAVPLLIRRIAQTFWSTQVDVLRPHRVARSKVVKAGELERTIEIVARKVSRTPYLGFHLSSRSAFVTSISIGTRSALSHCASSGTNGSRAADE